MFLSWDNVFDIAESLDIPHTEIMWHGTLNEAVDWFIKGNPVVSDIIEGGEAEGWVLRPTIELRNRTGRRIITKLKVRDFPERNG